MLTHEFSLSVVFMVGRWFRRPDDVGTGKVTMVVAVTLKS